MLGGLTRETRWRDVRDETPQKTGYLLVAHLTPDANGDPIRNRVPACRSAYWDGRGFMTTESPYYPLSAVTHWMPYPDLPDEETMRRVFAELLGGV